MPVTGAALITSIIDYIFQYSACKYDTIDSVTFDECINIDPIDGLSHLSPNGQKLLVALTASYVVLSYVLGILLSINTMDYSSLNTNLCGCCSHYSKTINSNHNDHADDNEYNIDEVNDTKDTKIQKCKTVLYSRLRRALLLWYPANVSNSFFNALAIENFSFATKNLFVQTILYKVFSSEASFGLDEGFLCWFGSIGIFVIVLYIVYTLLSLVKVKAHIEKRISAFNGDAFCLCFGYTFTILFLALLKSYPPVYRTQIESNNCGTGEDDEPCSKSQRLQYSYEVVVYMGYCLLVTILAAQFSEFEEEEDDDDESRESSSIDDRSTLSKVMSCFREFSSNMKPIQAGAAFFIAYQSILIALLDKVAAGSYGTLILALFFSYFIPKRMTQWEMARYRKKKRAVARGPGLSNCYGYFDENYNPKFVSTRLIVTSRMFKLVLGFSWEEFVFSFFISIVPNNFWLRIVLIILVTIVLVVLSSRLQDAFDKYMQKVKRYNKIETKRIHSVALEM